MNSSFTSNSSSQRGEVRGFVIEGQDLSRYVRKTEPFSIGHGAFTDVYKGELQSGSRPIAVAIKIFRGVHTDPAILQDVTRRLIRESRVWHGLAHSNIQPYFGYCYNPDIGPSLALVSPFCSNGTILKYLATNPDVIRFHFVRQIASGLQYLHENDVIHGDLSGNNVLIDDNGQARLADFGRARVVGHEGYSTNLVAGCVEYMAPELFPDEGEVDEVNGQGMSIDAPPFSKMSDVYAFSMLAFQLFTDRTPFQRGVGPLTCHPGTMIIRICRGDRPNRDYDYHHRISNSTWSLMEACWTPDPLSRPAANDILHWMRHISYA